MNSKGRKEAAAGEILPRRKPFLCNGFHTLEGEARVVMAQWWGWVGGSSHLVPPAGSTQTGIWVWFLFGAQIICKRPKVLETKTIISLGCWDVRAGRPPSSVGRMVFIFLFAQSCFFPQNIMQNSDYERDKSRMLWLRWGSAEGGEAQNPTH